MLNRYAFVGGGTGTWRLLSMTTLCGPGLPSAQKLELVPATTPFAPASPSWVLHDVMSNVRYATHSEVSALKTSQEPLGRKTASQAALIPIRKSSAWWDLAQDERRAIFEETSHHTAIGLKYLPAIARQLFHSRDINEPFDFLTWFEFAPEHASAFDDLLGRLRATPEWGYVEREIDMRLERV